MRVPTGLIVRGRLSRLQSLSALSAAAVLASYLIPASATDWPYLAQGAHLLTGSGWSEIYGTHPDIQVGPVALVTTRLVEAMAGGHAEALNMLLLALFYGPVLALSLRVAQASPDPRRLLLVGLVGVLPWTALALAGHLDELLALLLALLAVRASGSGRAAASGVLVGLAAGAKPWGITALPAVLDERRRRSALVTLAAATVAVLVWAPFVTGIYHSVRAGYPVAYAVRAGTIWEPWRTTTGILGSWIRGPQLLASLAAGAAVARRGPAVALAAAFSVRVALDPGQWWYQFAALAAVAVALDLSAKPTTARRLFTLIGRSAPRSLLVLAAMLLAWLSWITCTIALIAFLAVLLRHAPEGAGLTNRGRPRPGTTGSGPAQPAGRP